MVKRLVALILAGIILMTPVLAEQEISTDPADYPNLTADFEFGIQEGEPVKYSHFDDAVFIGDSISLKLYYYVKKMRQENSKFMGDAQFLVSGSLGSGNALWKVSDESVHPSYKGEKRLIENSVKSIKAKKVYIMLGMNDVALYGIEGSVQNMDTLIGKILEKSPKAEIYVQSATPRIAGKTSNPTNEALFAYNLKMYELCLERRWNYVDIASVMRDENGCLPESYCSDPDSMGMHFTDEACQVWIDYLLTHTGKEKK